MLMIGAVLSAFATPFAGQCVFADPVEPGTEEGGPDTSALCNPEDAVVYAPQAPSTSERQCPAHTREAGETARARAYLIATATPHMTVSTPFSAPAWPPETGASIKPKPRCFASRHQGTTCYPLANAT